MDVIEIYDNKNARHLATLNTEFYPIPPIGSTIQLKNECYMVKNIYYNIDERSIMIMCNKC